jgi:hypothetical protein
MLMSRENVKTFFGAARRYFSGEREFLLQLKLLKNRNLQLIFETNGIAERFSAISKFDFHIIFSTKAKSVTPVTDEYSAASYSGVKICFGKSRFSNSFDKLN